MTTIARSPAPVMPPLAHPPAVGAVSDTVSSLDDLHCHALVDQVPAVIYTVRCDAAETVTYISPYVESLLGYPPADFATDCQLWQRCIHPVDQARARGEVERTKVTGDPYTVDYRMVARDGHVIHVHDAALLVRDAAGDPVCWQGVAHDVTAQTHAKAALALSEARYEAVWDAISDAMALSDAKGIVLAANPAYADLYGVELGEVIGHPFSCIYPEEDRAWAEAEYQTVFTTPCLPPPFTMEVHRRDGTARDVEARATFVEREGVRVAMVSVVRDVTARTIAEAALAASEAHFRALVQDSTDIIVVFDAVGRLTYASPALERVLGHPSDAYADGLRLDLVHPAEVEAIIGAWTDVSSLPNARRDLTYRVRHADGHWVWLEGSVTNQLANPAVGRIVLNLRDVTEREVALTELRFRGELLDHATVAVIAVDPQRIVTHWNRHAETLYGWAADDAIGQNWSRLLGVPSRSSAAREIGKGLVTNQVWQGDVVCQRKDRTTVPVHLVISPIQAADGQHIGHVGISVDISERKALESRLAHQATHDALTGLANRVLFADRLEHALRVASRRSESVAVIMLDLDRFKWINDTLGHDAGDQVLVAVGRRLASCLRDGDTLARLGGDEFAIVLENVTTAMAQEIAARILTSLADPLTVGASNLYPAISIGIAMSTPDRSTPEEVLRASDIALYRAKQTGRGSAVTFDAADQATQGWLAIEVDLRGAVDRGELVLHYQPIVSLRDGQTVMVEALVRWQHPSRGLVPPMEFLPVAEATGLIIPLTTWVIGEACRQLAIWQRALGPRAPRAINVNITPRDLRDPKLVDRVATALVTTGLPAACLQLEITERVLVEELRAARPTVQRLRALGVLLAVDDFGAGASSLASLQTVDANCLKLDRAFVAGLTQENTRIVVRAITAMAHELNMGVTAEGIETEEQLALARASGCDRGQGYLFAPPLPPEDLETWMCDRAGDLAVSGTALLTTAD